MKTLSPFMMTGFTSILLSMSGCADWRTTPETVDRYHGVAVKNMISNQTLHPEHGLKHRQVLSIDGPKAETIIETYRAPQSIKLEEGKEPVQVDIEGGH